MRNWPTPQKTEQPHFVETKKQLSHNEIVNVLRLSFLYSQGSAEHQRLILDYVREYYGPQDLSDINPGKVSTDFTRRETTGDQLKRAEKNAHKNINSNVVKQASNSHNLMVFARRLASGKKPSPTSILSMTISQDHSYLVRKDGRPGRTEETTGNNTIEDKYFSFLVSHVIRNKKTDEPAYAALFNDLKLVPLTGSHDQDMLNDLIKKYNSTHPDTQVTETELHQTALPNILSTK